MIKIAHSFTFLLLVLFSTSAALAKTLDFSMGKALFDRAWTPAPASTDATDGLGPLFNARSCASCHPRAGRGQFTEGPDGEILGLGLLLRLGDAYGVGDRVYGTQLQTLAIQGLFPEGTIQRRLSGEIDAVGLNYGPLSPGTQSGGRLAPALHGLGLIARVTEAEILDWADPTDADGDMVSGRANWVSGKDGKSYLGRFGWKAGKHSLRQQNAAALFNDLGLSSSLFKNHEGECTPAQERCRQAPHGASRRFDGFEISDQMLDLITSYVKGLVPPTPANIKNTGFQQFEKAGCGACHRPNLTLENGRRIAAYTDLLLHDMGDRLADGIGNGTATGNEWRTAPLWGVRYATRYLHDGRAKSLSEAIALHGGEAIKSRNMFLSMSPGEQDLILTFLSQL